MDFYFGYNWRHFFLSFIFTSIMGYKLSGKIQHYAWGGYDYIPHLLHIENSRHEPFAEYWLGAHDKASSEVWTNGTQKQALNKLIQSDPEKFLGNSITKDFGKLPFLFKILDVKDMLSIQVHPTKEGAEKGFARENDNGIPLDSPERNYKDDNHKPEMMAALSEFYLLHGFRIEKSFIRILQDTPELRPLIPYFGKNNYRALYTYVMNMPSTEIKGLLQPLLNRVLPLYKQNKLSKESPDFWAARALDSRLSSYENPDRGIFSIYFLNIVRLLPGEGIFQAAGIPHAYLEGQNVELMANSDNVLRGGLTPKHVDVEELIRHTRFEGIAPAVLKGNAGEKGQQNYPAKVPDFSLSKIQFNKGQTFDYQANSPEILLILSGIAELASETRLSLGAGEAAFIFPGEAYKLSCIDKSLIYKASVPV